MQYTGIGITRELFRELTATLFDPAAVERKLLL